MLTTIERLFQIFLILLINIDFFISAQTQQNSLVGPKALTSKLFQITIPLIAQPLSGSQTVHNND